MLVVDTSRCGILNISISDLLAGFDVMRVLPNCSAPQPGPPGWQ
jgi:hypothetical protein